MDPRYRVTRDGRIIGPKGERKLQRQGNGYLGITYRGPGGKMRVMYLHKALAETFIPNPLGFRYVNHEDGNKHNNSLNNLKWCSKAYDLSHAHRTGLRSSGWEKRTRNELGQFV